jgi:DNA-binding transcriptional ArsR family regulator
MIPKSISRRAEVPRPHFGELRIEIDLPYAPVGPDYAAVAKLLSNQARSRIISALLSGETITASELGRIAGIAPSTASEHLQQLVSGSLVAVTSRGRNRYFHIAGPEVAQALEALALICPIVPARSLRASEDAKAFGFARTCYDHLAGTLGVSVLDALLESDWLFCRDGSYLPTQNGYAGLGKLDIDVDELFRQRRPFGRPCLDWSARRPHLGGALGAAVCRAFIRDRWVERSERRRTLHLTQSGAAGLRNLLGLEFDSGPAN